MKYNLSMINECRQWVERNGLMQPFGSTQRALCEDMRISEDSFARWMKKAEFAEAIKKAQDVFASTIVRRSEKSLARRVEGFKTTKLEEFGEIDGQTGEFQAFKAKRTTTEVPPDVAACIFVLTNADPEHWKNKQHADITSGGELFSHFGSPEEALQYLNKPK